ncbi:hypothetical protein EI94DRAFT_277461 [Lactarius quietus]|nr:hypothetical protein EI94DRAFT_277461 [Lactarius quietus]
MVEIKELASLRPRTKSVLKRQFYSNAKVNALIWFGLALMTITTVVRAKLFSHQGFTRIHILTALVSIRHLTHNLTALIFFMARPLRLFTYGSAESIVDCLFYMRSAKFIRRGCVMCDYVPCESSRLCLTTFVWVIRE